MTQYSQEEAERFISEVEVLMHRAHESLLPQGVSFRKDAKPEERMKHMLARVNLGLFVNAIVQYILFDASFQDVASYMGEQNPLVELVVQFRLDLGK